MDIGVTVALSLIGCEMTDHIISGRHDLGAKEGSVIKCTSALVQDSRSGSDVTEKTEDPMKHPYQGLWGFVLIVA